MDKALLEKAYNEGFKRAKYLKDVEFGGDEYYDDEIPKEFSEWYILASDGDLADVKTRFWSVVEKRGQVFHEVKSYKRKKEAINLLIKLKSKSLTDYNLVSILIGDNT